ncbi:PREDICTED: uncharacterized protein LOC105556186 [Vollenhovia emeryi]|uniref:uncharacterized protein LOC105556186 n=1 Tax=Vollenhovia emeryi TaxID=411798 RepID=UPI0005F49AD2|nr:PREDICTED: uncharacterized protein LOC105556186 [Vollenhovia emeryi]
MAYCHKFIDGCRKLTHTKTLTVTELERAEITVIRMVQQEAFPQEILYLQAGKSLNASSKLRAFDVYLDSKGLIRVGGRLSQAKLQEAAKHPIMLPAKLRVTNLIFRDEHVKLLHCGTEQLLASIRQKYWPFSGRREARKVVRSCLVCFRLRAKGARVKMGDLPEARVTGFLRPFTICGVDYAGPIQIRESRRRGRVHISKAYIALFICFNTRAIHLELVTSLTTEGFLAALHRFTGRRGVCSQLFSDNGTNFVGAERELSEMYEFLKKEEKTIHLQLAKQKINWSFIPPRTPNFGGLWESAVKRVKHHFNAVTKGLVLTFEECYTLLVGIEAVMNSRPLTPCSNDPQDLSVLTPSHFLVGEFLLQPVEGDYADIPENRIGHWRHILKVRQDFWHRWHRECLTEMQRRSKWTEGDSNLQEGMVLLRKTQTPPLQWHIGRIISVHPGRDGVVRVVSVKTAQGQFKRSARSVCVLPMDDNLNTRPRDIVC